MLVTSSAKMRSLCRRCSAHEYSPIHSLQRDCRQRAAAGQRRRTSGPVASQQSSGRVLRRPAPAPTCSSSPARPESTEPPAAATAGRRPLAGAAPGGCGSPAAGSGGAGRPAAGSGAASGAAARRARAPLRAVQQSRLLLLSSPYWFARPMRSAGARSASRLPTWNERVEPDAERRCGQGQQRRLLLHAAVLPQWVPRRRGGRWSLRPARARRLLRAAGRGAGRVVAARREHRVRCQGPAAAQQRQQQEGPARCHRPAMTALHQQAPNPQTSLSASGWPKRHAGAVLGLLTPQQAPAARCCCGWRREFGVFPSLVAPLHC